MFVERFLSYFLSYTFIFLNVGGSDKLHIERVSTRQAVLTIMNVQATDSGTYTCAVGPHRATFFVDISSKYKFDIPITSYSIKLYFYL